MKKKFLALMLGLLSACQSSEGVRQEEARFQGQVVVAKQMIDAREFHKAMGVLIELQKKRQDDIVEALLGFACLGVEDYHCSSKSFLSSYTINNNNLDSYLNYGYTLVLLKKYKEGELVFKDLISRKNYQNKEKAYVNLGLSMMERGAYSSALSPFKQAIDLDPTLSPAYFNLGKCYVKMKRDKEALSFLKRAVDFCQGCFDPTVELAKLHYRLGQKKESLRLMESLMEVEMDEKLKKRALQMLTALRGTLKK